MSKKDDGGPAFPCEVVPKFDGMVHEGMTTPMPADQAAKERPILFSGICD